MKSLRRIRGAIGMGLTWAFCWAIGGVLIGIASILLPALPWKAFFEVFDAPLPALAIPGFFAGVFFSTVLGIAGRHRRFSELSLPRFAAWGALGGVLLSAFPFALVAAGLASREGSDVGTLQIITVITGPFILLSAASASVTLVLARIAERRKSPDAKEEVSEMPLLDSAQQPAPLFSGSRPSSLQRTPDSDRLPT
jgi:hypothetical protein